MARGKVKYRDVVGGGRKKKTKKPFKNKERKTYSLYQHNPKKQGKKRKADMTCDNSVPTKEQKEDRIVEAESSESENEDQGNQLTQLLSTFSSKLNDKQLVAVDSSEDSLSDDENGDIAKSSDDQTQDDPEDLNNKSQNERGVQVTDVNENDEKEFEEHELNEENIDNANDPFIKHICYDLDKNLLNSLENLSPLINESIHKWPNLGRLIIQLPHCHETRDQPQGFTIEEQKIFAPLGTVPTRIDKLDVIKPDNYFIKSQITTSLSSANKSLKEGQTLFTELQSELFSIINNYQDIYYPERNFRNAEEIRFVYCLHAVNHILKTRIKVIHHNVRLSKKSDVTEEYRDQGLVRPKILILVPFKAAAYNVVQMIINILLPEEKGHIMNKKRFLEEYTGNEICMPKKNPKPEDYELTFSGNTSDDFRIGITVTKKSLKLFADFYSSDIIVASPLGLRTIIGAEGETKRDYDFLASIELLIMDQTELFYMQNWDHLVHVLNHLHLQPKTSHGTDFSRVRTWSLNGWAKYYRQTLIFSSLILPEINSVFNKKCHNYAGKIKISNPIEFGSIGQVFVQVPNVFHKFVATNVQQSHEARFDFFVNKILPQQRDSVMKQTLLFISNYFDFVRLRNYFKREDLNFVQVCEYSKEGKVARARDMFYHGDAHFLLYTERHHFFNRIRIKGIRHLIFYQLPNFSHFYYEICNLMQEGNMNKKVGSMSNMTVSVLYSKYDVHQLSAIVGTERASKMVHSERNVHMMVTGAD